MGVSLAVDKFLPTSLANLEGFSEVLRLMVVRMMVMIGHENGDDDDDDDHGFLGLNEQDSFRHHAIILKGLHSAFPVLGAVHVCKQRNGAFYSG